MKNYKVTISYKFENTAKPDKTEVLGRDLSLRYAKELVREKLNEDDDVYIDDKTGVAVEVRNNRPHILWDCLEDKVTHKNFIIRIIEQKLPRERKPKVKVMDSRKVFIGAYGLDCDGYNKGSISKAFSERMAEYEAEQSNKNSDGLLYAPMNEEQAREYCRAYDLNFNYINLHEKY